MDSDKDWQASFAVSMTDAKAITMAFAPVFSQLIELGFDKDMAIAAIMDAPGCGNFGKNLLGVLWDRYCESRGHANLP